MDVEQTLPVIPIQVFQMMMGGWAAQCLATVARLGIADELDDRAMTSDELARAVAADGDAISAAASSIGRPRLADRRRRPPLPRHACRSVSSP